MLKDSIPPSLLLGSSFGFVLHLTIVTSILKFNVDVFIHQSIHSLSLTVITHYPIPTLLIHRSKGAAIYAQRTHMCM